MDQPGKETRSEREGGGWERGSGRDEGGERGGKRGGGGRRGGEEREEGSEEESEGAGSVLVSESDFSSFCVSSAPFLAPPLTPLVTLSQLTFFNISTNPQKTRQLGEGMSQTSFLMSGCSFSSVWDVYDGGVVPSLNNPSSSLDASNTSFVGCIRSQNVAISGSEGNPSKPARQQIADNGANSFSWCVWNGSKTTGTSGSNTDGVSSGGAINMYNLGSGTLSVKFCSFNDCTAYWDGGGILCASINSIRIENNSFNACTANNYYGGGIFAESISSCVRISGFEFQKCKAVNNGGGLYLNSFQISESGCIGTENSKGESACVFECFFTSCSLSITGGGGMYCPTVPATQFKMRSVQFIPCSARQEGGGCKDATNPRGHDVECVDTHNLYLDSGNPFHECYTTYTDNRRICFTYNYADASSWTFDQTSKKIG
ncbi:uncharacterized protein MONOS_15980 [Monocercomonoides exilis]|uniref:uncharacterized protein n=1 Tax=Monocercomonoides exilis TaxID=2049356 RepID=UPI0035595030|nr:hypothetical protein MONOS_15980 [Monocercomonoides exilis]|eukprot:MONOS_15980.1-p1 / transcript=MONOS_15980.1 / gene=MONOS_15980 / organism=Monocercomonoides_exilis_PA203 / gene_product=unspecified product / transcript_product=unspecified product / location=Mono_scaffold01441:3223-4749(-) / protein_length=430 / sequence_SO=supercontig / SO=protein_coding / is_pseudo=false